MMSIVEEKRLNFASVLKKACDDARNSTVMVVPTFSKLTESVGLLSVDDNKDNTFPYIETNSPSKMLTPTNSPSTRFSKMGIKSNSAEKNNLDSFYESEHHELNSEEKEIICKQDLTLTEEDQEFLGIIGELNVFDTPDNSGDVSLYVSSVEKPSVIHCYPENLADQDFQDLTAYISESPERVYFQTENIQTQSPHVSYQPYSTSRSREQSPEDILKKKERNRLRSKAYRLRKKLQFEALKQEVEDAKIAAEKARQEKVVAEEKLVVSETK